VPFLRLTRDRRGIENTFLMHADRPGDRPRLLYWYRTAAGITHGRSPLDEDAIRAIEEQHPDIDFDWPAILALSEVMTPEDEAAPKPQFREPREPRQGKKRSSFPREAAPAGEQRRPPRRDERGLESSDATAPIEATVDDGEMERLAAPEPAVPAPQPSGLVDQLAGREIASRLRGRYAEITMRIRGADDAVRDSLMKRAEALDPDRWGTPDAVLAGVSNADALFEQLRVALTPKD
jgi:hypothetical protein